MLRLTTLYHHNDTFSPCVSVYFLLTIMACTFCKCEGLGGEYSICLPIALLKMCNIGRECGLNSIDTGTILVTGKHITKLLVHLDNNPVMNRVDCSNISSQNCAQSSAIDLILWCLVMN